jgi:3,4-dihydroxy 2-butanone 4-phosphate synthase/GTP cyclohydrolase II
MNGGESHLALVRGNVMQGEGDPPVLVRVHSHCLTGEVFGSSLCDCGGSVQRSLRAIAEAGSGALIYLHNGSRGFDVAPAPTAAGVPAGILLHRDLRGSDRIADRGPDRGPETMEDRHGRILRQVGLGGQILSDLQIRRIRLLSNTRTHVPALQGFGVEIVEQVAIPDFAEVNR